MALKFHGSSREVQRLHGLAAAAERMGVARIPVDVRPAGRRRERQRAALVVECRDGTDDQVGVAARRVVGGDLLAEPHAGRDRLPYGSDARFRDALDPAGLQQQGRGRQVGRVRQPREDLFGRCGNGAFDVNLDHASQARRGRDSCRPGQVYSHTCSMLVYGRRATRPSSARSRSGLARRPGRPPSRIAAIAELVRRRCGDDDEHALLGVRLLGCRRRGSLGGAGCHAQAGLPIRWTSVWSLRYRLPRVAELFMDGGSAIGCAPRSPPAPNSSEIGRCSRCIDSVDLRPRAESGGAVSTYKLEDGHRRLGRPVRPGRPAPDPRSRTRPRCPRRLPVRRAGITGSPVWLYSTDAAILDRRLKQMAHGVCDDDPRTIGQRRADALGALAAGSDRLALPVRFTRVPGIRRRRARRQRGRPRGDRRRRGHRHAGRTPRAPPARRRRRR